METQYTHLSVYCSACNDPEGSSNDCSGGKLPDVPDTYCAINGAKALGLLGRTVEVKLKDGSTYVLTVRDHCGKPGRIDMWKGVRKACYCNFLGEIKKVTWHNE